MNDKNNPSSQDYEIHSTPKHRRQYTMPGSVMFDEETQYRIRRWFGMDFMVVLLFVMLGLYFLWPLLYGKQDRYVTETAIRDGYSLISHLREQTAAMQDQSDEEVIASIQKHPALKPVERENAPRIYIIDAVGTFRAGNEELPPYWEDIVMKILPNQRGVEVYSDKTISTLLLFDNLPGTELKIVLNIPFNPMFSSK
jgi:hypothetical protein